MLGVISLYTFIVYDDLPSAALLHAIWFKDPCKLDEDARRRIRSSVLDRPDIQQVSH